jgi:hypothetical protein
MGTAGWMGSLTKAHAAVSQVVRFDFNAGHLMNVPRTTGTSKSAGNQKIIARDIYNINGENSAATWTSSQSFNRYERWAKGLSAGEGLASFNIFLRSDMVNASSWGQQLKLSNVGSNFGITATAAAGWQFKITQLNQSHAGLTPGPGDYGYSIQWWTSDDSKRVRFGSDLNGFSFAAPVELFDSTTNSSWAVEHGMDYTVWFGTQNRPDDQLFQAPDNYIKALKFDNNWMGGVATDTFAEDSYSVWNGTLNLTANVIPEPSTGSLLLVGAGLVWLRRRRSA